MEKSAVIKVNKLCKSFSNGGTLQHVLKNVDLEIYRGDFTVIMGASGAGKSTLLYALSGMDKPTLGSIIFDEKDITKMGSDDLAEFRRKSSGFVFQSIYLIDSMSILDNVLVSGLLTNKLWILNFFIALSIIEGLSSEGLDNLAHIGVVIGGFIITALVYGAFAVKRYKKLDDI